MQGMRRGRRAEQSTAQQILLLEQGRDGGKKGEDEKMRS